MVPQVSWLLVRPLKYRVPLPLKYELAGVVARELPLPRYLPFTNLGTFVPHCGSAALAKWSPLARTEMVRLVWNVRFARG